MVGPGVPLRKGVKPPDHVLTKEELARLQAQRLAEAEAARKAAAAAAASRRRLPQRGGRGLQQRQADLLRTAGTCQVAASYDTRPSFAPGRPPVGGTARAAAAPASTSRAVRAAVGQAAQARVWAGVCGADRIARRAKRRRRSPICGPRRLKPRVWWHPAQPPPALRACGVVTTRPPSAG